MNDEIIHHPLFVGLTRPPMRFGVTLNCLMLNGGLSLIIFVVSSSFVAAFLLAGVIHGLGYIACLYDPRIFDLLIGQLQCMNGKNRNFWRCNSYEAF